MQKYYNKVLSLGHIAHKICLSLFIFVQPLYERHVFSLSPSFVLFAAYLSGVSDASDSDFAYNFSPVVGSSLLKARITICTRF